jgi:hypothetical protein
MDQATRRSLGPGLLATEARRHRGANKEERDEWAGARDKWQAKECHKLHPLPVNLSPSSISPYY